ncbi:MAG: hypothetical protein RL748_4311 [Pseudomonadota bacterium]
MLIKRHRITESQIGFAFNRTGFETVLERGTHYLPSSKRLELCNLNDFPAQLPQLEWLAANHAQALQPHLELVKTGIDEIAMLCRGQTLQFVLPNQLQAFWKKGMAVEMLRTRLPANLQVPTEWLNKLPRGVSQGCIKQMTIPANSFGLLFADTVFCNFLLPGEHAWFDVLAKTQCHVLRETQVVSNKDIMQAILQATASGNHAAASEQLRCVTAGEQELVAFWDKTELVHLCAPTSQVLAHHALTTEIISLQAAPQPLAAHMVMAMRNNSKVAQLLTPFITNYEVPSEHVGLLYVDGVLQEALKPGFYSYWHGGKRLSMTMVDTRLTVLEITGQEMLTQDKVPLRVNVTAGYRIVNAPLVMSGLADYKDFIYKEIQFALRAAIGSKTLDGLLENKNETDEQILATMKQKAAVQGIDMISLGIKDLILPGEIKTMLAKVVEAEKAAQANVIRRREETAATRSLMNTSKVMEDNPVALRLKELETLEKITEKIDHISVYGGLESLLKQVAAFKPKAGE